MVKSRADLAISKPPTSTDSALTGRLIRSRTPVPYDAALARMDALVDEVRSGAADTFWFLEHPPVLTAGTSAKIEDLRQADRFPVHRTGRGGQFTYHGPGQRIVYAMVDLRKRGNDVRRYVAALEEAIIATMGAFNVTAYRVEDRVGVWVPRPEKPSLPDGSMREDKIAAIGIRVSRGVAFHGLAINHEPDLSHYDAIVPCGVRGRGVTSLVDLGLPVTMDDLDLALAQGLAAQFGSGLQFEEA
ncbi:MAG: lipoyl(octanoyl) transferase LipB [Pseudomonadota bacterium]